MGAVTNFPQLGAMTVPPGLAPGLFAALAWLSLLAKYDFPFHYGSALWASTTREESTLAGNFSLTSAQGIYNKWSTDNSLPK